MRLALACALLAALAACAPRSHANLHLNSRSGQVTPSLGTSLGAVSVSANPYGGAIGTRIGALGLSAGF